MDVIRAATRSLSRVAIASRGQEARYQDVLSKALCAAALIQKSTEVSQAAWGQGPGPRIAVMAPPGRQYVEATLGSWLAGGIAVPLCLSYPREQLRYILEDAQVSVVLSTPEYADQMEELAHAIGIRHHSLDKEGSGSKEPDVLIRVADAVSRAQSEDGSLIIYTSGTTGPPKGALHTHRSLSAQVAGLCSSWEWQAEDRILHTLPLHHIHGIVNALFCALSAGAAVEFLPKFSPTEVWKHLQREEDPVTVFMGVPTMYSYLLSTYDQMPTHEQAAARAAASRLRLTVSGSAACPVPIMERWEQLSGQRLLERYGMTETGMILSNPYRGERRPGSVGLPLPGMDVRTGADGELKVRGDNLFKEYWGRPEVTTASFDSDGYFWTGDTASMEGEPPYWRILGRTSTDIIKSGGYKISALQIEDALLSHPRISNCAVLGVADDELGEAVTAIITCQGGEVSKEELREFAGKHLPKYQVPSAVVVLDDIPRNAMGKINKKALRKQIFPDIVE